MDEYGNGGEDSRLLVISNRLPVRVERMDDDFVLQPSVGGLATSITSLKKDMELEWLGWPGLEIPDPDEFQKVDRELRERFSAVPLAIPRKLFDKYYNGFSNGCIWPLFHYFPQYAHFDPLEWKAYQDVNALFLQKVLEIAKPTDRIWVHDYQLMLLPEMLREALPESTIGFFLHIPFPSYEIFRMLPWRNEILRGLIGADLIGFHSFSYARHFLSSLLRLLGLEHEFGRVSDHGRPVRIDTFPLGVDVDRINTTAEDPEVIAELDKLESEAKGRKVVLSVDRLDFTKGILERLTVYERFLNRYPRWRENVTLMLLCVPSRTRVQEYRALKRQVDEAVGRVNGKFGTPGWTPIWYMYRALPFERLVPLYELADVALVTPLRDGMNLIAKEYLAARPDGSGVLILSETAGAAEELGEALIVNPHDLQGMVKALDQALNMPLEEQRFRNQPMLARLRRYGTIEWANDFLNQLSSARGGQFQVHQLPLRGELLDELLDQYRRTENRVLFLDYDGTLVPFTPVPSKAAPDQELIGTLKSLSTNSKNHVAIISGRNCQTLEEWLGETSATLIAEHGACSRNVGDQDWKYLEEVQDQSWKDHIRPVMQIYVDRTPGAILEEKSSSLAWHYRRAEPDLGSLRAKELVDTLEGYIANTSLQILQGSRVIEVRHSAVSKGRAAQRILQDHPGCDFVLAAGDDTTDEDLFSVIPKDQWSIKVREQGQSIAQYSLPNTVSVRRLLKRLEEVDQS